MGQIKMWVKATRKDIRPRAKIKVVTRHGTTMGAVTDLESDCFYIKSNLFRGFPGQYTVQVAWIYVQSGQVFVLVPCTLDELGGHAFGGQYRGKAV